MVTIYDIAKQANVSAMTVSRVINNKGRISDKTRKRIKKIIEELHYIPNSTARSLVLQETKILSLLITDITNPFYTTLARGAEDAAKKLGYRMMFGNSDENIHKEKDYVDIILSTRVDGVLFAPSGDQSVKHLELFRKHKIPFVILDREIPGMEADMVLGDSHEGARKLVEQLIEWGHRSIAFINGSLDVSTARLRLAGFREAITTSGIHVYPELIYEASYAEFDADLIINQFLACADKPTAIFAANNFLALGAMRSLRKLGLNVPEDISIVCFDDVEVNSVIDPFLTVAAQPAYEFGHQGVELLIDRIQGKSGDNWRHVILPSTIHLRKSARRI